MMDTTGIQAIISSVGFPIAMCLMLCWYIFKVQSKLTDAIGELTQMIKELNQRLSNDGGRAE